MKTLLIAEVAQSHDGSLGNALCMIDACAEAGANAVKFQYHYRDPNCEMPEGYDLPQDEDRKDYWDRTAFHKHEWPLLAEKAKRHNLLFGVTPFSVEALELVAPLCDFIKISRQDAFGTLHDAAHKVCSLVIHTGTGGLELDHYTAVNDIEGIPPDIRYYSGISCHDPSIKRALQAVRDGAVIVEKHVCWDRRQFGPDTKYSITIDELAQLAEGIRNIEKDSSHSG